MSLECSHQRLAPLLGDLSVVSVVHSVGRHEPDAAMAMDGVVPVEEHLAVRSSIFDRAEACGEVGPILQCLGAPCKGAISQWEVDPPGDCRSSR